jgi:hypothetical protein
MDNDLNLDDLWEAILSAEPARVRRTWLTLTDEEASAVLNHLRTMADEPGWAEAQRQAAAEALRLIASLSE